MTFSAVGSEAPSFLWAEGAGGSGSEQADAIAFDAADNMYIAGMYAPSIRFGTNELFATNGGMYLVKYYPDKEVQWMWHAEGAGDEVPKGVEADSDGNVFLAGGYTAPLTAGDTTLTNQGLDIFLAKLGPDGTLLWLHRIGDEGDDRCQAMHIDSEGNVHIAGSENGHPMIASYDSAGLLLRKMTLEVTGEFRDFGITPDGETFGIGNGETMFVAKYSRDGTVEWVNREFTDCNGISLAINDAGGCYISGNCGQRSESRPAFGPVHLTGYMQVFLARLDGKGNILWVKTDGSPVRPESASSMILDHDRNIYVTGWYYDYGTVFGDTPLPGAGWYDLFVAKYDPSGNLLWAKGTGTAGKDFGHRMAVDSLNRLHVVGTFGGYAKTNVTAQFDSRSITNVADFDAFIAMLDTGGTPGIAPDISIHPQDQEAPSGATVTFSARVTGTEPFHFQWYKDGNLVSDGPDVDGANSVDLLLSDVAIEDAGSYVLVISNNFGVTASSEGELRLIDIETNNYPQFDLATMANSVFQNSADRVAVDDFGNSYVAGGFFSTLDLGPTNLVSAGDRDIYLVKRDFAGRVIWALALPGSEPDYVLDLALDSTGNCYLASLAYSVEWRDDRQVVLHLRKVTSDGGLEWNRRYQCTGDISATIAVHPLGAIRLLGVLWGTIDFNGTILSAGDDWHGYGAGVFIADVGAEMGTLSNPRLIAETTRYRYVDAHYDLAGNLYLLYPYGDKVRIEKRGPSDEHVWLQTILGADYGLFSVAHANALYVCAYSGFNTFIIGTNTLRNTSVCLAKLASDGNPIWVRDANLGTNVQPAGLALDSAGNPHVIALKASGGLSDILIAQYDRNGELGWTAMAGGPAFDRPASIALDPAANVYVAGQYGRSYFSAPTNGSARFGGLELAENDGGDSFLVRLRTSVPPLSIGVSTDNISLTWSIVAANYELETCSLNPATSWRPVDVEPEINGAFFRVNSPLQESQRFFRLRQR